MSVSYDVTLLLNPLVKMHSLRFHKERYEFQCDRSDNQHEMTKKNTPVKESRLGVNFFFFVPRS